MPSGVETRDAVRSRRNVRQFDERPVGRDQLDEILEAARRTPSSTNWQPWDFVVVTDKEQLAELAKVWRGAGHVARSTATIALIGPVLGDEHQRETLHYDLGQATMSIMLAAADLGIGTGHAAVSDQQLARAVLGLPEDRFCAYLVALGYPADRPLSPVRRPDRRPFGAVVHRGRW